jgi:para-aminobenzoate synthetase/4-amino-4-deoxychorismate lyase
MNIVPNNAVLLESLIGFDGPMLFRKPNAILRTDSLADVISTLSEAEHYLRAGYYIAGYLAYEAGYAFESRFKDLQTGRGPLVWLGVYDSPVPFSDITIGKCSPIILAENQTALTLTFQSYRNALEHILNYIAQGDVYQVNYTFSLQFPYTEDPFVFYRFLRERQRTDYAAFIRHDDCYILSLSPELFFRVHNGEIVTKPMKGTKKRGKTMQEDLSLLASLTSCPKNRAENIMIVDLLRNDLGRVCRTGSVRLEALCDIERYKTLYQMTSTVSGQLHHNNGFLELIKNLFPCGSVTGAPKVRAMEIIHDLECSPRGVYTGAIGYAAPNGDMRFNVAIRTLTLQDGIASLGIGSGIIADSDPEDEYKECVLKSAFLFTENTATEFQLIETMRVDCGIPLLQMHLDRLQSSTNYFNFTFDRNDIESELLSKIAELNFNNVYRMRLLLSKDGAYTIEIAAFTSSLHVPVRLALSTCRISSKNVMQYHKTTDRALYTKELNRARAEGFFDVLFLNERNEIAEGCISNVFIEKNGKLLTPPVSSGILQGVYRRYILETNPKASEAVLTMHDLYAAEQVFISNAVYGILPAIL